MSELKQIDTPNAPSAVGAYSQAIAVGDFVFTSGNLPIDPVSKAMPDDIKAHRLPWRCRMSRLSWRPPEPP